MKRLILLLFVFGLLACGQKQEAKVEETPAVEEAVTTVADSASAVVDSAAAAATEGMQE